MGTETILTPLDIFKVAQQHKGDPCAFARAIEQAVMQSPEVQEFRRDAGRYQRLVADWFDNNHEGDFILMNNMPPDAYESKADIDEAIDAMEKHL